MLVERADHVVGRRQIGRIGDAYQNHLGGRERAARGGNLGHALEQHLPGARKHPHGELFGTSPSPRPLDLDQRGIIGNRRNHLHSGDEMGELCEVGQDHGGIGADVVLRAQLVSAAAISPRINASNRSIIRARSASPNICRTCSARTDPAACAMA